MSENALHLKFKSCVHQFTVHFFRTSFFAFPFPGCAVRASSSSPPGVVCFPWRFVCLALGDSSSALRTCSSILLFHCRGKLRVSVNGCILCISIFAFVWIKLIRKCYMIRMTHTDQVDPYFVWVIRINFIHMIHTDQLDPYDLF